MSVVSLDEEVGTPTDLVAGCGGEHFFVSTSGGFVIKYTWVSGEARLEQQWRPVKRSIRKIAQVGDRLLAFDAKGKAVSINVENGTTQRLKCDTDLGIVSVLTAGVAESLVFYLGNDAGDVFCCELGEDGTQINVSQTFDHHDDYIACIVHVAKKRSLLVGSGDGIMSVIDLKKGRLFATTNNLEQEVTAIICTANMKKVLLGTGSGSLRMVQWNFWGTFCDSLKSGVHQSGGVNNMVFVDDKRNLAVLATEEGTLYLLGVVPLRPGVKLLSVDDSFERVVVLRAGSSDELATIVAITATEPTIYLVSVKNNTVNDLLSTPKPAQPNGQDDSASGSSDSEGERPPKLPKKTPNKNDFFQDLD